MPLALRRPDVAWWYRPAIRACIRWQWIVGCIAASSMLGLGLSRGCGRLVCRRCAGAPLAVLPQARVPWGGCVPAAAGPLSAPCRPGQLCPQRWSADATRVWACVGFDVGTRAGPGPPGHRLVRLGAGPAGGGRGCCVTAGPASWRGGGRLGRDRTCLQAAVSERPSARTAELVAAVLGADPAPARQLDLPGRPCWRRGLAMAGPGVPDLRCLLWAQIVRALA